MEMSKLQTVALVVLTTIITDKFLISHPVPAVAPVTTPNIVTASPLPSTPTTSSPAPSPSSPPSNTQNELILKELQNLRKDLASKTASGDTGSSLSTTLIGGMVKISSPQWKRVDVYEKSSNTSKIINTISYDTIYFYTQKITGWYQLNLDGGQNGWVQSQFLKEYP
jgi:hypothetical protein